MILKIIGIIALVYAFIWCVKPLRFTYEQITSDIQMLINSAAQEWHNLSYDERINELRKIFLEVRKYQKILAGKSDKSLLQWRKKLHRKKGVLTKKDLSLCFLEVMLPLVKNKKVRFNESILYIKEGCETAIQQFHPHNVSIRDTILKQPIAATSSNSTDEEPPVSGRGSFFYKKKRP